jgi:hydrogenase maturation protease
MSGGRTLVAGIGNIFFGDDGFGSEVARKLMDRPQASGVTVIDFGIRGLDLAYAILDGYDTTILIDTVSRGGAPGTIYTIEPSVDVHDEIPVAHSLSPLSVLRLARTMGAEFGRIVIIGCEPATFGGDEGQMGLSEPIRGAVDQAVQIVESLTCMNFPSL